MREVFQSCFDPFNEILYMSHDLQRSEPSAIKFIFCLQPASTHLTAFRNLREHFQSAQEVVALEISRWRSEIEAAQPLGALPMHVMTLESVEPVTPDQSIFTASLNRRMVFLPKNSKSSLANSTQHFKRSQLARRERDQQLKVLVDKRVDRLAGAIVLERLMRGGCEREENRIEESLIFYCTVGRELDRNEDHVIPREQEGGPDVGGTRRGGEAVRDELTGDEGGDGEWIVGVE